MGSLKQAERGLDNSPWSKVRGGSWGPGSGSGRGAWFALPVDVIIHFLLFKHNWLVASGIASMLTNFSCSIKWTIEVISDVMLILTQVQLWCQHAIYVKVHFTQSHHNKVGLNHEFQNSPMNKHLAAASYHHPESMSDLLTDFCRPPSASPVDLHSFTKLHHVIHCYLSEQICACTSL